MRRWLLLCCLLPASPLFAQTIVLDANFDSHTVDAPVGEGGATAGEPVSADASLLPTIRSTPFPTPSLELQDTVDFGARFVQFTFAPEIEYASGIVTMQMDLWFKEMDDYLVYVRRVSSSAEQFLNVRFDASGFCVVSDEGGTVLSHANSYTVDQPVSLQVIFDMDAGTYDLSLDGALLVDDQPHDVDASLGVGSIYVGMNHDADLDGLLYLDNLLVTATVPTAVSRISIGELKSLFAEPSP